MAKSCKDCIHSGVCVLCQLNQTCLAFKNKADVVEVRHGEDTGKCRIFQCSICGYGVDDIYQADEWNYPVGEFNFCPNCGAKMDGGKEVSAG